MGCLEHVCKESEYEARNVVVVSSVAHPNTAPCNSGANKQAAERQADIDLRKEVHDQGEKADTCHRHEGCTCGQMPEWPSALPHGWEKIDNGIQVDCDVLIGINCRWTVTLKYDRYYRSRSADCLRKPLAMLHARAGSTVAA
jgi:hypothetical protein